MSITEHQSVMGLDESALWQHANHFLRNRPDRHHRSGRQSLRRHLLGGGVYRRFRAQQLLQYPSHSRHVYDRRGPDDPCIHPAPSTPSQPTATSPASAAEPSLADAAGECAGLSAARTPSATVSWNANTEADLAGYRIYVGTMSGSYGFAGTFEVSQQHQLYGAESAGRHDLLLCRDRV